jgi:hypothetical protein
VDPARALRQSQRFLVILEGELPGGFLQTRASACALVARALRPPHRVLLTRQDWPLAIVVLQVDSRSSLRDGDLPSGVITRTLPSAGEG